MEYPTSPRISNRKDKRKSYIKERGKEEKILKII